MSYRIVCPDWGELKKYQVEEIKGCPVFHFRVNYYPYYIAHLVNDNTNSYAAVEKFFQAWGRIKLEGKPIDTHSQDPPANIVALVQNAFDEYMKNPYSFSAEVKQQINVFIGVIKKWTAYKKFLKPID